MSSRLPAMRQHFVRVQGHRLAALCAHEELDGVPFILLHGIMGSYTFWPHALPPEIRDGRRWYAITLPGHFPGRLPGSERTGMPPKELGEILNAVVSQLIGDEPVIVMGYSTGGYAALVLAATHPDRVRGLITMSGFASGRWRGTLGLMQWLGAQGPAGAKLFRLLMRLCLVSPTIYKAVVSTYANDPAAFWRSEVATDVVRSIFPYAWRHDAEAMRQLFCTLRELDIRPLLHNISAPTLVIGGREDPVLPQGHQEDIARRISGSELYLLDGVGHLVYAERTAVYHRTVTSWLERHFLE